MKLLWLNFERGHTFIYVQLLVFKKVLSSAYRMVEEIIQSMDVQIMNFHLKSNSN